MQKMSVMFDSGSALMYIVTEKCSSCPQSMSKFDTTASTTYKPSEERQSQSYGSGSIEGLIVQDTVCMARDELSCL